MAAKWLPIRHRHRRLMACEHPFARLSARWRHYDSRAVPTAGGALVHPGGCCSVLELAATSARSHLRITSPLKQPRSP